MGLLGRKIVLKPLPTKSPANAESGPSGGATEGGAGLVGSGRSSPKKKSLGKLMVALDFESLISSPPFLVKIFLVRAQCRIARKQAITKLGEALTPGFAQNTLECRRCRQYFVSCYDFRICDPVTRFDRNPFGDFAILGPSIIVIWKLCQPGIASATQLPQLFLQCGSSVAVRLHGAHESNHDLLIHLRRDGLNVDVLYR